MKKLLATAAICGLVVAAAPAHAEIDLDLGGYFKGYGFYSDQDDSAAVAGDSREFDIIRNTELHLTGETTLDNGLTVGYHTEIDADANNGADLDAQEGYAYFSSGWGRVNLGAEDGAAYLLQVAAPSADSNLDGIRQYVNPINYEAMGLAGTADVNGARGGLDYDQDVTGYADKLTYLSPVFSGFQVGLSYTPDVADVSTEDAENENDVADALGAGYDAAVRYEGTFDAVGFAIGAGYTHVDLEANTAAVGNEEDQKAWNVGLDLDIGAFGVGVAYLEDNYAEAVAGSTTDDEETMVVGVDYTTGPFKLGASYLNIDNVGDVAGVGGDTEADRYAGGVTYTYGPGMTFRGSVSYTEVENATAAGEADATAVLIGTQIDF